MKQRLVVMNCQRIVEAERDGRWTSVKVEKAKALKPGIYNLYLAETPQQSCRYDGVIVHIDDRGVYQLVDGKKVIVHCRNAFDILPAIGVRKSVAYASAGVTVQ